MVRHARISYPTDVSDAEWAILEALLPAANRRGRPRADLRQVFNAIAMSPAAAPSRTRRRRERGFDGAKLIKGRKRHLLVDTLGLVHGLLVHSAGVQDRTGGRLVLEQCRGRMPRLRRIWADGAYRGRLVRWVRRTRRWVLQIIARPAGSEALIRIAMLMALRKWGVPGLALCGAAASPATLELLCRWERLYALLDNDKAGQAGTARMVETPGSRVIPVSSSTPCFGVLVNGKKNCQSGKLL